MQFDFVAEFLQNNKDETLAEFSQKLTPGAKPLLGVKIPILRRFAKTIDKNQRRAFIQTFREQYQEDLLLKAIVIGLLDDIDTALFELDVFKNKVDNWAVCDILCNSFKIAKKYPEKCFAYVEKLALSDRDFDQRIAVVLMLSHFVCDGYIDKCFLLIEQIKSEHYYVDMAVGWFISVAYVYFSHKTYDFIAKKVLSYNKCRLSVKKIKESFRVEPSEKIKVGKLFTEIYE